LAAGDGVFSEIQAEGSAGLAINNSGGATVLTLGAGAGTGATFAGGVNITGTLNSKDPDLLVESDVTGVSGADPITNVISLTQAEYDAITPDASTLYVITS